MPDFRAEDFKIRAAVARAVSLLEDENVSEQAAARAAEAARLLTAEAIAIRLGEAVDLLTRRPAP